MHPSALAKRVPILLTAIIIAFYLYGLGKLPLLGPDEPRYAQVAREMKLSADRVRRDAGLDVADRRAARVLARGHRVRRGRHERHHRPHRRGDRRRPRPLRRGGLMGQEQVT